VPCFHFHLFSLSLDCLRGIGRTDDDELSSVCFDFRSRIRAFLPEKTTTCFVKDIFLHLAAQLAWVVSPVRGDVEVCTSGKVRVRLD
jgi:hypothetical protein